MYSSTSSKDSSDKVIGSKPALILNDSHVFDASNGMLDSYSERGNFPVILFFFSGKFSTSGLFLSVGK
jgi:hypothetical protein